MSSVNDLINDADPAKKIKRLQKIVDQQARTIERIRNARVKSPKSVRSRRSRGAFIRVVFGDVHGDHMEESAVAAFLSDIELLKPAEVICIGDLIDCGGFLSQHKTLGVVAELDTTYEQDVAAGSMVLDGVQKRAPKARFRYLEGNHENRINRWICDQVLGNAANADYLRRMFGPAAVLNLAKRGIEYHERHEYYDNLSISGTIKLEPFAIAQHGEAFCGKYAAYRHIERLAKSVFFGHSHRLMSVYAENLGGALVAVNTGCLCKRRPLYGLTKTTDWTNGYVVEFVEPGQGFLALPVPIIDGVSYLSPLMRMVG